MIKKLNVESIEKDARSIAEVLAAHKVFGVVANDASPAENAELERSVAHEKEHFVGMVLRHALDPQAFLPLTLKYHDTGAWVRFNTYVIAGTALFRGISVVPVLSPNPTLAVNPNIDYEALATDIQRAREYNVMEDDEAQSSSDDFLPLPVGQMPDLSDSEIAEIKQAFGRLGTMPKPTD